MVRPDARGGFTLLEVLLVVILLALGAALVPPDLRSRLSQPRASVVDSVAALVRSTRAVAIEANATAMLVLGPPVGRWWRFRGGSLMDDGSWSPEQARLLGPDERITVGFSPTGQLWTTASIRFLEGGDTTTLVIDAWSGRVRIE